MLDLAESFSEIGGLGYVALALIALLCSYLIKGDVRKIALIIISLVFYASFDISLVFTVILMGFVNFYFIKSKPDSKTNFYGLLLLNALILLVFKVSSTFNGPLVSVGISFVFFQILGYNYHVYSNAINKETSYLDFQLFVCFFPQLVAGPIEKYDELGEQLKKDPVFDLDQLKKGVLLFLSGCALKFIISDRLHEVVSILYAQTNEFTSFLPSFLAIASFTFEIYVDFLAYCLMAEGIALSLGISLTRNFIYPYNSFSGKAFWRNWHTTLHRTLKEVLYLPLLKKKVNPAVALVVVFALSALWHGFDLTFLLWGLLWAVVLLIEEKIPFLKNSKSMVRWGINMIIIALLWVPFRADSLAQISSVIKNLAHFNSFELKQLALDIIYQSTHYFTSDHGMMYIGKIMLISYGDFFILSFFLSLFILNEWRRGKVFNKIPSGIASFLLIVVLVLFGYAGSTTFMYTQF